MRDEVLLLTPGPTPIHPRAKAALSWPVRGHMDPEVMAFNDRVMRDLEVLYSSAAGAFACLLSGTGSFGMEVGFANLLEPGEPVVIVSNGVFGERMIDMASRLGAAVAPVRFPPGVPAFPEVVREVVGRVRPKLLAAVHGETSTGVLNPVADLGAVAKEFGALFSVDAVTTVGMLDFEMRGWGVDYAYTGSQKCLSGPVGLAPAVFGPEALVAVAERKVPVASWYGDVEGMRAYWQPSDGRRYHHTVPVQLHWATGEAVRAALDEGVAARTWRVRAVAEACLQALSTIGFKPFVPAEHRLPTVLALTIPEGFDDARVRYDLRFDHGISVTGGLGPTEGRIWRLGLMGEAARIEHYQRLMTALATILDAAQLPEAFDQAVAVA